MLLPEKAQVRQKSSWADHYKMITYVEELVVKEEVWLAEDKIIGIATHDAMGPAVRNYPVEFRFHGQLMHTPELFENAVWRCTGTTPANGEFKVSP